MLAGLTPPLAKLIDVISQLPGIGPKTAQRLAFFILRQPVHFVREFAATLVQAYDSIHPCSICHHLSGQDPCEICCSTRRNTEMLCVVADPRDVLALERTHQYGGLYHVLGGLISPLDGIGPEQLHIRSLLNRLPAQAVLEQKGLLSPGDEQSPYQPESVQPKAQPAFIKEVILALPPSTEGDTTSLYLARQLQAANVVVSRIAFGLPVGGELDYADNLTLTRALQGRRAV